MEEVKREISRVGIDVVTTTTLNPSTNLISSDPKEVRNGIKIMKELVDINVRLGSCIIGGVNYAAWGYLPGRPRTEAEWNTSIKAMKEIAKYAKETSDVAICLEPVNRFETHFLNIAEDAVRFCKETGDDNLKVHLVIMK